MAIPGKPSVSVIIASHNYGRFLGDAIESCLSQSQPVAEVIVVDDASTDDSLEVAARFPVRCISQRHAGVSAARNRGARASRGELLTFLDADDMLAPTFVERCWEALRASLRPVAYAYCQMRLFGTETGIFESSPFSAQTLPLGNYVPATTLLRRRAFEKVGGFNVRWRTGYEDYELWLRMLCRGYEGVLVPEPLLHYRRHGQTRNSLSDEQLRDLRERLKVTFPRLYWRELVNDPVWALGAFVRSQFRR